MARVTIVVAAACFVALVSAQPGFDKTFDKGFNVQKSVEFQVDSDTAVGKAFGAGVGAIVPNDANRAACESYGFIDPQLKTGKTEQHGIWSFAKSLADTFLPSKAARVACIQMGYFHPDDAAKTKDE